jgi:hypothetical protein
MAYFVGTEKKGLRDSNPKQFCGFEVDYQVELRRLLQWKLRRFLRSKVIQQIHGIC